MDGVEGGGTGFRNGKGAGVSGRFAACNFTPPLPFINYPLNPVKLMPRCCPATERLSVDDKIAVPRESGSQRENGRARTARRAVGATAIGYQHRISVVAETICKEAKTVPGEPGSIPDRVAPRFSHVGIVPDYAAGQRVFSGILQFPLPFHSNAAQYSPPSPASALKTSTLRAAHISLLTYSKGHSTHTPMRVKQGEYGAVLEGRGTEGGISPRRPADQRHRPTRCHLRKFGMNRPGIEPDEETDGWLPDRRTTDGRRISGLSRLQTTVFLRDSVVVVPPARIRGAASRRCDSSDKVSRPETRACIVLCRTGTEAFR
ncbi:hypothetical protein PR048_006112 [Dryococelus australis]|uniref:Uncharacterized protein n=1 Tax=Dryococelus australis TaxID=614101 RepID=A0ABQ9IB55_9NEOP|nr:hypothetical protein PR048_006112 [Dryococelus australis]